MNQSSLSRSPREWKPFACLLLIPLLTLATPQSSPAAAAKDAPKLPQKAPDPKDTTKKVYEWKSADGVAYVWRGPKKYDPAKGAGLTVILHGSNLTRLWGFANHNKDTFRPDDLVVCPDGTTANGTVYNFQEGPNDLKKFQTLLTELKAAFKIRGTYLYGHSQGSFFALKYAGENPTEVDGVVAHASGLWASSKIGPHSHHQAIVLMHGTLDPTVPYGQSIGGYDALKKVGYPMVRLRSLEGWNHWPAELNSPVPHTSQQLAWVEGMTTKEPDRLAAAFDAFTDVKKKEENDWAGLYLLAKHIATHAQAPAALKARAQKAVTVVENLGKAHAAALAAVKPGAPYEKKPWVAHLPIFLRAYMDVPAREELATKWKDALAAQEAASAERLKAYQAAGAGVSREAEAFDKGVSFLAEGYLTHLNIDGAVTANLASWAKNAKSMKLTKEGLKSYESLQETLKEGSQAFAAINGRGATP